MELASTRSNAPRPLCMFVWLHGDYGWRFDRWNPCDDLLLRVLFQSVDEKVTRRWKIGNIFSTRRLHVILGQYRNFQTIFYIWIPNMIGYDDWGCKSICRSTKFLSSTCNTRRFPETERRIFNCFLKQFYYKNDYHLKTDATKLRKTSRTLDATFIWKSNHVYEKEVVRAVEHSWKYLESVRVRRPKSSNPLARHSIPSLVVIYRTGRSVGLHVASEHGVMQ